jgi:arsenate reductase
MTVAMKQFSMLFLCTHNSARSILGEVAASTASGGKFVGYSAGALPSGVVHPLAHEIAIQEGFPTERLRSKSWDEFAAQDAPSMDMVITVCDGAAGEVCPVWVGRPVQAHWAFADPSRVVGGSEEKRRAFREVFVGLQRRVEALAGLPLESFDEAQMRRAIAELEEI